ncbi:DinB family protein [Cohnella nanjingensis]|uniref:DinB family protein n=1 Tax=Cohnella nanjingensis TaxID=1387779 RepID=A0A7X0VH39_9BACL|nr:DinB family protein [Cohnella nanjingensis]MBB6673088.1 DinB family protein [Cohnella nanjingensis]
MFTTIDGFVSEWNQECRMTLEVMNALTDASLSQSIREDRRTLGQLAWHLVKSPQFMAQCGLAFEGPSEDEAIQRSAAAIADEYRRIGERLVHAVQTQWQDEDLAKSQVLFGQEWQNGATLRFTLMHQAHHRGQMTVLMSQAGLRVPGLYGPTYETWVERGMTPLV